MKLRADARPDQPRNRLLAAMLATEFKRLQPNLELVELPVRQIISRADCAITHAYFIEDGLVAIVQHLIDGAAIEVGLIGREGFVGIPIVLGARTSPAEANVLLKTSAFRITAKALREAVQRSKQLNSLLLRYIHALHIQVTQAAACNCQHNLQQRLARFLLSALDCADSGELGMSHEYLAMMLGRRRAGVTVALGTMRSSGLIKTSQARIQVVDRRGLEKAACECYRVVRDEYRRLLP